MIELAPKHKYGLPLATPLMPASGVFGFGDAYRDLIDLTLLGAVVTNPISLRPRRAARGQRIQTRGDTFVVHTGWPNPGLHKVVRDYRDVWSHLPVPVIVHLLATQPTEVAESVGYLSSIANVAAVELGYATQATTRRAVDCMAAAQEGTLPVIAQIPLERMAAWAPRFANHGADALTLTAPPRAVLPISNEGLDSPVAHYMRGRLYGRALFPLLLNVLSRWSDKLALPIIACGGIGSPQDALDCLTLGATAVQIDALLWKDPPLLNRVGHKLRQRRPAPTADGESSTNPL